jgi:hypothetical protein
VGVRRVDGNHISALTLTLAEEAFGERMMGMLNNQIQIDRYSSQIQGNAVVGEESPG